MSIPTSARIVIIGGGAIGCSIAYHLSLAGVKDVLLIEKTRLTEGATWHAAGLVGQFRSQENLTRLMMDSVALFDRLADETGQQTSWRKVGSLRIAASSDRFKELLKSQSAARGAGFEMELLSATEAKQLYPLLDTQDLVGAAFIPADGHIDPYSLTQAYAKGIRNNGGRIIENLQVNGLVLKNNRITAVETDSGNIDCEVVVNAAGLWARQVGWMAGIQLPAGVVEHQYLVTEKTDLIANDLPAFRDPDGGYYAKPEPGALAIGGWEKSTPSCGAIDGFGWENSRHLFDGNMDRLEEILIPAAKRLPILNELGIRTIVNGPIPISPDGEPLMGPVPGLENFFVACGFTSGIAASGGAGKALASWIVNGDPGLDLWAFDVRRFGQLHCNHRYLHDRAIESYSQYYAMPWPGKESTVARGVKRSPLYTLLKSQGAVFGSKFGWERANWFNPNNKAVEHIHAYDREHEVNTIGPEHYAARNGVVLIDMSSFTKLQISGKAAHSFLQFLAVAQISEEPGSASYTQLCNASGGIEADVTIITHAENCFWLITGSALGVRDTHWIQTNLEKYQASTPSCDDIALSDITSAYGVINIAGPLSRRVLEKVSDDDLTHENFVFMRSKTIQIGYAQALAYRVTYIGELGWELYISVEYMQYVYELLKSAGEEFGIRDIGYKAIDSLRLEKRHLAWGTDITPDYNPYEAGLDFLINWDKGNFMGADALMQIRNCGVARKLVCFALDQPLPVFGGEAIYVNSKPVALTTSGNYGYSVNKSLVLGYLPVEYLDQECFQIESFGQRSTACLIEGAIYDPKRKKVLC